MDICGEYVGSLATSEEDQSMLVKEGGFSMMTVKVGDAAEPLGYWVISSSSDWAVYKEDGFLNMDHAGPGPWDQIVYAQFGYKDNIPSHGIDEAEMCELSTPLCPGVHGEGGGAWTYGHASGREWGYVGCDMRVHCYVTGTTDCLSATHCSIRDASACQGISQVDNHADGEEGGAGCYMAAVEDCDPARHPYATDCYTCENIDVEATRHGFCLTDEGTLDLGLLDETFPALCAATNSSGNYSVLGSSYSFYEARDACYHAEMRLASFATPAEATAARAAVRAAGVYSAWTAAWRDMDRKTWGWYGYSGEAASARVEWHVFDWEHDWEHDSFEWEHDWEEKAHGGAKGCPGYIDPNPYFESRGCCLDEYNDWCIHNYAEGTRCENNACVNSDCCVPAPNVGAIVGGVVGALAFLCIGGATCVVMMVQKQNASRLRQQTSPQAISMPTATAIPAATISATATVASPGYATAVAVPYGGATPCATAGPYTVATAVAVAPMQEDGAARLARLKGMLDEGLITQADFDGKKAEILQKM